MHVPLYHVDAFTDQPFAGNPAAVCLLSSWLDDETLRKVSAENNLSATAFVVERDHNYELRWFTVLSEIKLCGHATLGAAFVLLHLLPELQTVHFATRFRGNLTVRKDDNFLWMDFPAYLPKPCGAVPETLAQALGLKERPSEVLEVNDTFIAVLDDEQSVRDVRPDFALLEQLHPHAVSVTARGDAVDFVSRYFAPAYGIPEDPVTGSAHCALTPYWTQRLGKSHMHARQLSERGGEVWCEMAGDRVTLKGQAVLTMTGKLTVEPRTPRPGLRA